MLVDEAAVERFWEGCCKIRESIYVRCGVDMLLNKPRPELRDRLVIFLRRAQRRRVALNACPNILHTRFPTVAAQHQPRHTDMPPVLELVRREGAGFELR